MAAASSTGGPQSRARGLFFKRGMTIIGGKTRGNRRIAVAANRHARLKLLPRISSRKSAWRPSRHRRQSSCCSITQRNRQAFAISIESAGNRKPAKNERESRKRRSPKPKDGAGGAWAISAISLQAANRDEATSERNINNGGRCRHRRAGGDGLKRLRRRARSSVNHLRPEYSVARARAVAADHGCISKKCCCARAYKSISTSK